MRRRECETEQNQKERNRCAHKERGSCAPGAEYEPYQTHQFDVSATHCFLLKCYRPHYSKKHNDTSTKSSSSY